MPSPPPRHIGTHPISPLGLGCMSLSIPSPFPKGPYPPEPSSLSLLTRAADLGVTFWDTSDVYGPHHNETLLGKWFKLNPSRRDEIFVCTKFGVTMDYETMKTTVDGTPGYVRSACEASLERLGVGCIDLWYMHRMDNTVPIEVTVKAMAEMVKEGKVRYLGLSECSAETLRRACRMWKVEAVQVEFSPWALEIETNGLLEAARELGVKVVVYSPLGRGWLTGAITKRSDMDPGDARVKMHPRFSGENFPQNLKLVEAFKEMAKEKGCTPGQLALAWVMAQGDDFIPIPGTKNIRYLEENAGALQVEFSQEDEKRIRNILDKVGGAKGARYTPAVLAGCFGDTPALETWSET